MAENSPKNSPNQNIFIQLSSWGGFFIWKADHVEVLRRKHRIVGHLSFSPQCSSNNVMRSTSANPSCLPLQLTLEETSLLLFKDVVKGVDVAQPVTVLEPPSIASLMKFDEDLARHRTESSEVLRQQKRQRTLGYYSEILRGRNKRRSQPSASENCIGDDEMILYDDQGIKFSKKRLKKMKRRKQQKSSAVIEPPFDHHEDSCFDNYNAMSSSADDDNSPNEGPPTLEELVTPNGISAEAEMVKHIPLHRPLPTPPAWKRPGEHSLHRTPSEAFDSIRKAALWVLGLSLQSRLTENNEAALLRCKVFENLWSKGFYVTCSAAKMGGDFLVYRGDPLFYHASHIVSVHLPSSPGVRLSRLSASLRIANSVRKIFVLATEDGREDATSYDDVVYTSMYWMGSKSPATAGLAV